MALTKTSAQPKNVTPEDEEEEEGTVLHSLQTDGPIAIKIADIINIAKCGIPGAGKTVRPIDSANLAAMLLAEDDKIPPMLVQPSSVGFILIDGGHRLERAIYKALYRYNLKKGLWTKGDDGKPVPFDLDAVRNFLTVPATEDKKAYVRAYTGGEAKFIDESTVLCQCLQLRDYNQVIEAAFRANLTHGKPSSMKGRCAYALWKYQTEQALGHKKFSMRDAGKLAGVSASAISQFAKAGKRLTEDQQEGMELDTSAAQKAHDQEAIDARIVKLFAKSLKDAHSVLENKDMASVVTYVRPFFKASDEHILNTVAIVLTEIVERIRIENSQIVDEDEDEDEGEEEGDTEE